MEQIIPGIYRLRSHMQHYAWGDHEAIPTLTGHPNPESLPCAELWMGAHPELPSEICVSDHCLSLDEMIQSDPEAILGARVATQFDGHLPFLFKLLAAAEPLSIQVHPDQEAARKGFDLENSKGIPLKASHRLYKDKNHKPELIVALVPFFGLRGFRPLKDVLTCLEAVPEFRAILASFPEHRISLNSLYEYLMRLDDQDAHSLLAPVLHRIKKQHEQQPFAVTEKEFWLLRADESHSKNSLHDRGLFSFFLLNLVCLEPGQGMYLPAGILHAYLEGFGVELMANSNNVLRGGLTSKHMDVDELLDHVDFRAEEVEILQPAPLSTHQAIGRYSTPALEFELQRIESHPSPIQMSFTSTGPEILLAVKVPQNSHNILQDGQTEINLAPGQPVLICGNVDYQVSLAPGTVVFRALVPS